MTFVSPLEPANNSSGPAMARRDSDTPSAKSDAKQGGFGPLHLIRALFSRQVRLKRGEKGLEFVLETTRAETPATPATPSKPAGENARRMHADLVALLNGAAGSRRVMRHLAGVEHGLAHKDVGGLFLFETPVPQLTVALHQLETLLPDNPPAGLAALRTRLAEALAAQDQREHDEEMQRPLSSLLGEDKLEVSEARASDFDKASDAWQDRPATGQPR